MSKYAVLVNILDQLRAEAPAAHASYHPLQTETAKVDQARCKTFIHLFLKVRFGLLSFAEREAFFTDGKYDGGIDAYFVDQENKAILLIQSKFRTSQRTFEEKEIELKEIFKIEADRISAGETTDEDGNPYNSKVQAMIRKIQAIPDSARYKWQIIILANLKRLKSSDLHKYTGGFSTEVFDFDRSYNELVFPVVNGSFFNVADLFITLNLTDKEISTTTIKYPVKTRRAACEIAVVFVPTSEIGRVLHLYKNSLLTYNPRNYLDLSRNAVNGEIRNTIVSKGFNEFALYNNGITMLSSKTELNLRTGRKGAGQIYIKNPQIINGGQTAYTLSRIYEEFVVTNTKSDVFDGKEVMVKVITVPPGKVKESQKLHLIEDVSKATNQQTPVTEADRRSNDKVQVELQKNLFNTFGYFYERKRGEFLDGVDQSYVGPDNIINRQIFLRICSAQKGQVADARRMSARQLFEKEEFKKLLHSRMNWRLIFFGYVCYRYLSDHQRTFSYSNNKFGAANYGQGLRYGKYAIVSVAMRAFKDATPPSEYAAKAREASDMALSRWLKFESYARKQTANSAYFYKTRPGQFVLDFDGYYKGATVDNDLSAFKF